MAICVDVTKDKMNCDAADLTDSSTRERTWRFLQDCQLVHHHQDICHAQLKSDTPPVLLDCRTREDHDRRAEYRHRGEVYLVSMPSDS